jgi:hypothetical protein
MMSPRKSSLGSASAAELAKPSPTSKAAAGDRPELAGMTPPLATMAARLSAPPAAMGRMPGSAALTTTNHPASP